MRLIENNELGEPLYECDRCQMAGPRDSCIIEDNHQYFCMSCWYEKQRSRMPRDKRTVVVEI